MAGMDELQLFHMYFPEKWIVDSVIPQNNKIPIDFQEFYVWLGCVFFMLYLLSIQYHNLWWPTKSLDVIDGVPFCFCLNKNMMKARFHEIMKLICYTSKNAPLLFVNCFHEVQEMIDAFDDHYSSEYKPSWLSCIDESMNLWLNML